MDEHQKREMRTRQIIANAERLIAEVDDTLARADRLFANSKVDRASLAALMDKNPEAAKMMAEVQKNINEMAREMDQKNRQFAAEAKSRPAAEPATPGTDTSSKPRRQRTMI